VPRKTRCFDPGTPYHVTERGIDRERVFFHATDRLSYLTLASSLREATQVRVLAWCLMTNHVHWVIVPEREDSLPCFFRHLQGRYAQAVNARRGRTGHLWHNRYFACALDRSHLWTAIRYTELNPVRAGIIANPIDYRWSSAASHLTGPEGERSQLLDWAFWREHGGAVAWREMLQGFDDALTVGNLRTATYSGKPYGSDTFICQQEERFGRHWQTVGRPKKPAKSENGPVGTGPISKFSFGA
jgi:REP-associated tyrosine transposase